MKHTLLLIAIMMFFTLPWMGQAEESWQASFNQHVKQWAKELADSDGRFSDFVDASFSQQALGPHSRQWLIVFREKETEEKLGYFIVGEDHQNSQAFILLEYGLGEYTLFDDRALQIYGQPSGASLTPHYEGLQSVWVSEAGLYDAKSGEKYPSSINLEDPPLYTSQLRKEASLQVSGQLEWEQQGESPEEIWIRPEKPLKEQSDLMEGIAQKKQISLIAQLFDGSVTAPFTVIGYHLWDQEELFVELDDYGSRYIPYKHAIQIGFFSH